MWIPSATSTCPRCNMAEAFKCTVLKFSHPHLYRLCVLCNFSIQEPLPKLNKKIIYLDQWFVSNVRKSLDHYSKMPEEHKLFYLKSWEKLSELYRLHLIICPYSHFHQTESLLDEQALNIQKIYEKLAGGVFFKDPYFIYRESIYCALLHRLGVRVGASILTIDEITHGDVNAWLSNFGLSLVSQNLTDIERAHTKQIFEGQREKLQEYLDHCKGQNKTYKIWYKEIVNIIIQDFKQDLFLKRELSRFLRIQLSGVDLQEYLDDFFENAVKDIPYFKIYASILAKIAHDYSAGSQISDINRGMFFDIQMISTLLPHCDAMLIDKPMEEILDFEPGRVNIAKNCSRFTIDSVKREQFLTYLENIKNEASLFHKELVNEIYGDDSKNPLAGNRRNFMKERVQ